MSFGVSEHVNKLQLNIGVGKHSLVKGEQTGEVIVDERSRRALGLVQRESEGRFSIPRGFALVFYETAQDFLSSVAVKAW